MTVEALKDIEGVTPREAERSKNFFALGLMSWLYGRPVDGDARASSRRSSRSGRSSPRRTRARSRRASTTARRARTSSSSTRSAGEARARARTGKSPATRRCRSVSSPPACRAASPLFLGAYPITPASAILEELARYKHFGVRTFQAEDEIAAVGAALGASFGGALGVTHLGRAGHRAEGGDGRARRSRSSCRS